MVLGSRTLVFNFVSVFLLLHNRSEEACYSPSGSIEEVCAFHPPTGSREENSPKQEAHGPHRSPEKTVQINKHI